MIGKILLKKTYVAVVRNNKKICTNITAKCDIMNKLVNFQKLDDFSSKNFIRWSYYPSVNGT